jgi:hypothetical protein
VGTAKILMSANGESSAINMYWIIGNVCASLVGAGTRLLLSNSLGDPIANNLERNRVVAQLSHYLFHPLTYVAVVVLLLLQVIRLKGVGFWSVVLSFIIGGISASFFLALL